MSRPNYMTAVAIAQLSKDSVETKQKTNYVGKAGHLISMDDPITKKVEFTDEMLKPEKTLWQRCIDKHVAKLIAKGMKPVRYEDR